MLPHVPARPPDLPDFEHPPVVEVALSVQFEPLSYETRHIALLWDSCRQDFPEWQDHVPIAPAFELFGEQLSDAGTIFGSPPLRRAIFRNSSHTQLKQYQGDRFVRNWTKADSSPTYPRYGSIREPFATDLTNLIDFVAAQSLGNVVPNQCEVTYVNLVPLPDGHAQIASVLRPWVGTYSDSFLDAPESTDIACHFVMRDGGKPIGRLHIASAMVAYRDTRERALQLTLTARGRPLGQAVDGVLAFLDVGRDHIVRGFASFTTPEAHKTWGRRHAAS
jgi:uncharacterized protein (TIGR04255 family)